MNDTCGTLEKDATPPTPPPSPSLEAQIEAELAASASGEFLSQLEEEMRCSVCLSLFEDPRLMPCGHTFCRSCLEQIATRSHWRVQCPHCRHIVHLDERGKIGERFPPNAYLRGVIERINVQAAVRRERRLSTSRSQNSSRKGGAIGDSRNGDGGNGGVGRAGEQQQAVLRSEMGFDASPEGAGVGIGGAFDAGSTQSAEDVLLSSFRSPGHQAESGATSRERRPFRILSGGGFNDLLDSCDEILTAVSPPLRRRAASATHRRSSRLDDGDGDEAQMYSAVRGVRPMLPLESTLASLLLAREHDQRPIQERVMGQPDEGNVNTTFLPAADSDESPDSSSLSSVESQLPFVTWSVELDPEEHRFAPFCVPTAEVIGILQAWADSLWFAPGHFFARMKFTIEREPTSWQIASDDPHSFLIRPMWIPFWCFDVHTQTRIKGTVARREPVSQGVRMRGDSREVAPDRRVGPGNVGVSAPGPTRAAGSVRTSSCTAELDGHHEGLLICANRNLDPTVASLVRELIESAGWRPGACESRVPLPCPEFCSPPSSSRIEGPNRGAETLRNDENLNGDNNAQPSSPANWCDDVPEESETGFSGMGPVPVPALDNLLPRDRAWALAQEIIFQRETANGEALLLRENSADRVVELDADVIVTSLSYHLAFLPSYVGSYGCDGFYVEARSVFGTWNERRQLRRYPCVISAQTGAVAAERPYGLGKVSDIARGSGTKLREWLGTMIGQ